MVSGSRIRWDRGRQFSIESRLVPIDRESNFYLVTWLNLVWLKTRTILIGWYWSWRHQSCTCARLTLDEFISDKSQIFACTWLNLYGSIACTWLISYNWLPIEPYEIDRTVQSSNRTLRNQKTYLYLKTGPNGSQASKTGPNGPQASKTGPNGPQALQTPCLLYLADFVRWIAWFRTLQYDRLFACCTWLISYDRLLACKCQQRLS